jgi:hypothetical protein
MALSATCPPKVLEDIIKTLCLKAVVDGNGQFTQHPQFSFFLMLFIIQTPIHKAQRTSPLPFIARISTTLFYINQQKEQTS